MADDLRTRFARLYPDGSMGIERAGLDFETARRALRDGSDDDDVELLEVRITVIRTHGRPKLAAVRQLSCTCPTCGEIVSMEAPDAE